jgi:hypothetical protein
MGWFSRKKSKPKFEELVDSAFEALESGQLDEASRWFESAARDAASSEDALGESSALSNLAQVRKLRGDLSGALAAADRALAALGSQMVPDRGPVLLARAGVLDDLGDPRAQGAWSDAALFFESDPLMQLVCLAHAEGARAAKEGQLDPETIRGILSKLPQPANPGLVAGIVGAVADSAGEAGLVFYAQVGLLMLRSGEAFNTSTVHHLLRFVERVGPATPITVGLCVLGLVLCSVWKGQPEYMQLMNVITTMLSRCAEARGIDVDRFLDMIQSSTSALGELEGDLRELVPSDRWVIAESAS